MPTIKNTYSGYRGTAGIATRQYVTQYLVTGLTDAITTDLRGQIMPTSTTTGLFPTPGTYPTVMPDGYPLPEVSNMRVVSVNVLSGSCTQAIVEMVLDSHDGSYDTTGSFLLAMKLGTVIEWTPSNFAISDTGERGGIAQIRYDPSAGVKTGATIQRIGELSIPRPRQSVSFTRLEPKNYNTLTQFQKNAFVGTTNSVAIWGGDIRTWLCTSVESEWVGTSDSPWRVTYQFIYKPELWTEAVIYIDTDTNRPPQGITQPTPPFIPGNEAASPVYGAKFFQIAGIKDFSTLDLPSDAAFQ